MMLSGEVKDLEKIAKQVEKGEVKINSCSNNSNCTARENHSTIRLEEIFKENREFVVLYYNGIKVEKDITYKNNILFNISILIFLFSLGLILLIFFYSKVLSKETRKPIILLNKYLENINEKAMDKIPKDKLPDDLHLLADTINNLINRIDVFIGTQKELFIGASHELKTPLAVIKLKNQVTLMKERDSKYYIEALKITNEKVDEMNVVVSDVLNIGREESAQFEQSAEKDVILILQKKSEDFQLLAKSQNKIITISLKPAKFIISIQETLLNQIIQNFLQNALKFTEKGKKIELKSFVNKDGYLIIEVIDEGVGIDTTQDIFAPFNRKGNKSGVGLGLFLAKSGADSMGAKITVENRKDGVDGAIATLELKNKLICDV